MEGGEGAGPNGGRYWGQWRVGEGLGDSEVGEGTMEGHRGEGVQWRLGREEVNGCWGGRKSMEGLGRWEVGHLGECWRRMGQFSICEASLCMRIPS
jgi:hypothetical protein